MGMGHGPSRHWVAIALLVVATGCGGSSDADPVAEPVPAADGAARAVADATTTVPPSDASVLDRPGVNPEGVINAAVLLESGGDVDAALASGAFSRADLDAARDGLDDGSLGYLFD